MLWFVTTSAHFLALCSAACQERNDASRMFGVGRQYNEPVEAFWAFLAALGTVTQVRGQNAPMCVLAGSAAQHTTAQHSVHALQPVLCHSSPCFFHCCST